MKIKYETNREFLSENISKNIAMKRIKKELENLKADNIVIENDKITFKKELNEWKNKNSLMAILDNGTILFESTEKIIKVHLICYFSILEQIIVYFGIGGILSIFLNYWCALLCIYGIIMMIVTYNKVSNGCEELISTINQKTPELSQGVL
jgi:hypothetical protein